MKPALWLGLVALLAALALGIVAQVAEPRIARLQRAAELERLRVALPPALEFDNDPIADVDTQIVELAPGISLRETYPARKGGRLIARVFKVRTQAGYSGAIDLLMGVRANGEVINVRVLAHRETPGLGDPIEESKSDWITRFTGRSLSNPDAERWAVSKDGGAFDAFSGATITPRAVVEALKATLEFAARTQPT